MADVTAPCTLCGSADWRRLSDIRSDRSVRTDGGVVLAPMGKWHCAGCGVVNRRGFDEDPALLYGEDYQLYANRPNADAFDVARHGNLVAMIQQAWGEGEPPRRVLEAGCGDGGVLVALSQAWPSSEVFGVEPSAAAVARAQGLGRPVRQGLIGGDLPPDAALGGFDLVYSIHVVEHTLDPSTFVDGLARLLAPGGRIVITCPDGAIPHAEIIHPDHLWSMTRRHLGSFVERAGLRILAQGEAPAGAAAEFSQSLVCAPGGGGFRSIATAPAEADDLFERREAYLALWRALEAELAASIDPTQPLLAFGAGGWAANIAGNCPDLWVRVEACVIDGGADATVQGKPVLDYNVLADAPRQFIAAVNPALQDRIARRLAADGHRVLPWPKGLSA